MLNPLIHPFLTHSRLSAYTTGILAVGLAGCMPPNRTDEPLRLSAPVNLRCEYALNPLGIDTTSPRLSWEVNDPRRCAKQTAYQIVVSMDPAFANERVKLWDTGKVASEQSAHVAYAGRALQSRMRCYWKVQTWDTAGQPSGFSVPGWWEMGLLQPTDWTAHWIGPSTATGRDAPLPWGEWIWNEQAAGENATAYFRTTVDLPADAKVELALIKMACDNSYVLFINGQQVGTGNNFTQAQRFVVTDRIKPGRNVLAVKATNSDGPAGLIGGGRIMLAGGNDFTIRTDAAWLTSSREEQGWNAPDFAAEGWTGSKVLAQYGEPPWNRINEQMPPRDSLYLRKTFKLSRPIARARAYASGLGLYQLRVNGEAAGPDVFAPGWTHYGKRIQYQTYDVTSLLKPGDNAMGALLGNGWWSGGLGWDSTDQYSSERSRVLVQLAVEYTDGTAETIGTDASWAVHASPILRNTFYHGETHDARLEQPGWDTPVFNAEHWRPAGEFSAPSARLVAQASEPILVTQELKPVWISEPDKGIYIVDFGQNAAGRMRIRVTGPAGNKITMRFGEVLDPNGRLYRDNYRTAEATDIYICKGTGEETWEPTFTYRGFRFCEVSGWPQENPDKPVPPAKDAFVMRVLHSAAPPAGNFECSNWLINRIYRNIKWGQRSNMHSVPTDCPQRDERLGWMGDAQAFAATACWNMNMARFFTKWLRDIEDSGRPDGAVTDVAPAVVVHGAAAPGWGDAVCIVPWTVYQYYGDQRVLEENYSQMVGWVEYMRGQSKDDLYEKAGYGDWVPAGVKSPSEPIGSAYYYLSTMIVARTAAVLGRTEDAKKYEELATRIRTAFNARHLDASTNWYTGRTQTANILPLWFGITPEEHREGVLANIVKDIKSRGYHLSTGFMGTTYLMPLLALHEQHDVAFRLATQTTQPSWGYMVLHGGTTIWELWDADKQGPNMNSRNHFTFGAVAQWFYETIGGLNIDPQQPGFKHAIIRPRPMGDLTWARAEHLTVYGLIYCDWRLTDAGIAVHVVIPANTTAAIHVPLMGKSRPVITENGEIVLSHGKGSNTAGIHYKGEERGATVFEVGAGQYQFELR